MWCNECYVVVSIASQKYAIAYFCDAYDKHNQKLLKFDEIPGGGECIR